MKERMVSTDVIIEALSDVLAANVGFNPHGVIAVAAFAGNLNRRLMQMQIGWSEPEFENVIAKRVQEKRMRLGGQPPMMGGL